ncbi:MAG TPA: winged helix-turn-helix domain-containing protein [Terriglobales bacterium]|nr:winged helix-turn-helix domain-containing protein [Terriglobales bacterium]
MATEAQARLALLRTELVGIVDELDRLRRLVRAAATTEQGMVEFDGAALDTEELVLRLDGVATQLTPGWARIVGALLAAKGRAVSRAALAQVLFGDNATAAQGRDVDAQVGRMRARIPGVAAHIETVRSVGYRWKARTQCQ